jgi:hypothetical protein
MLPGFRFLLAAVVLSVSMLVFGLGAAALLRATHEEFASLPLKQIPEVVFASRQETEPTLAVLQVDTPIGDPDRHDPAPEVMGAASAVAVPTVPEIAPSPEADTAVTEKVATLSAAPRADDTTPGPSAPVEKTAVTPAPAAPTDIAPAAIAAPSMPVAPKPDTAAADGTASTPAPAERPNETQAAIAPEADTAGPAESTSGPTPTGQTSVEAAPAPTARGDSKPAPSKVDNTTADNATTGSAPGIAEPKVSVSTTMATAETSATEVTGSVTSDVPAPAPVEAKAVVSDQAPQGVSANVASPAASGDAPAKIAALNIPMPVERPKAFDKASLTIKPVAKKPVTTKKHAVKRRPIVRRARIVRPAAPPKPADPFAGSPFSSN